MKAAAVAVILVACGHAAPAPAKAIANTTPPVDAGPACTKSEPRPMHLQGDDASVALETCTEAHHTRVDLVIVDGDQRMTTKVDDYDDDQPDRVQLVGVLPVTQTGDAEVPEDDLVLVLTTGADDQQLNGYAFMHELMSFYTKQGHTIDPPTIVSDMATVKVDGAMLQLRWMAGGVLEQPVTP